MRARPAPLRPVTIGRPAVAVAAVVAVLALVGCSDAAPSGEDPVPGDTSTSSEAMDGDATDPSATPPTPTASQEPSWELVFADEFEGPAGDPPDPRWWTAEIGGDGWGNQELQYYTDDPTTAALDGEGHLVITATEGPQDGPWCWYGRCEYLSARLSTQGKVEAEYGRIAVRAQLPVGEGMWPAFWMLGADIDARGWPAAGEIDVMEHIGREPDRVHGTVHGPMYAGADGIGGSYRFTDGLPSEGFHTYAVEWEPDRIRWYVDDAHYGTLLPSLLPDPDRWVFDGPFFLLLNLAVGGRWPGPPDEETTFPQQFVIDHVRVYREGTTGE